MKQYTFLMESIDKDISYNYRLFNPINIKGI